MPELTEADHDRREKRGRRALRRRRQLHVWWLHPRETLCGDSGWVVSTRPRDEIERMDEEESERFVGFAGSTFEDSFRQLCWKIGRQLEEAAKARSEARGEIG